MSSQHDNFIFQITAGNLGDCVVAHRIDVLPLDREVYGHLYFFASLDHARNAVVVFHRQHELRHDLRRRFVVRLDLPRRVWTKGVVGYGLRHTR